VPPSKVEVLAVHKASVQHIVAAAQAHINRVGLDLSQRYDVRAIEGLHVEQA